jgi:carbonic anhydrase
MSQTDDLIDNASRYAESFDQGALEAPPRRRVAILTCMDARLDPARVLGLEAGDAHVIRNAGGLVTGDAIRSLAISQRALGTEEVVLIQHTRCGLLGFDDAGFRGELEAETGAAPDWEGTLSTDIDANVRGGVAQLRSSPFLTGTTSVRGFVYDVETGRLREVT